MVELLIYSIQHIGCPLLVSADSSKLTIYILGSFLRQFSTAHLSDQYSSSCYRFYCETTVPAPKERQLMKWLEALAQQSPSCMRMKISWLSLNEYPAACKASLGVQRVDGS
jgi:hypothetical protein